MIMTSQEVLAITKLDHNCAKQCSLELVHPQVAALIANGTVVLIAEPGNAGLL